MPTGWSADSRDRDSAETWLRDYTDAVVGIGGLEDPLGPGLASVDVGAITGTLRAPDG